VKTDGKDRSILRGRLKEDYPKDNFSYQTPKLFVPTLVAEKGLYHRVNKSSQSTSHAYHTATGYPEKGAMSPSKEKAGAISMVKIYQRIVNYMHTNTGKVAPQEFGRDAASRTPEELDLEAGLPMHEESLNLPDDRHTPTQNLEDEHTRLLAADKANDGNDDPRLVKSHSSSAAKKVNFQSDPLDVCQLLQLLMFDLCLSHILLCADVDL
jgi:hypothetical protein